jgi:hypothetical protein
MISMHKMHLSWTLVDEGFPVGRNLRNEKLKGSSPLSSTEQDPPLIKAYV